MCKSEMDFVNYVRLSFDWYSSCTYATAYLYRSLKLMPILNVPILQVIYIVCEYFKNQANENHIPSIPDMNSTLPVLIFFTCICEAETKFVKCQDRAITLNSLDNVFLSCTSSICYALQFLDSFFRQRFLDTFLQLSLSMQLIIKS